MLKLATLVAFGLLAQAAPTPPALRLNHDVEPRRFAVDLHLDPAKDTFAGMVIIDLDVKNAVDHFWLNATDLKVTQARLEQGATKLSATVLNGGDDFVGFQFPSRLVSGAAKLTVMYTGQVNRKSSQGVFRSEQRGDKYLYTQFEPIDARRAFPCFDEPNYKIPWQLTVHVPQNTIAVANTGVDRESNDGDGSKTVRFRETKPLPSYLIAFAVGPFEFVEGGQAGSRHVPVRIVVPRGDRERARYAASISAEILTRLENYFGIPYPYDKSDQLAVPLSFGGAMENPGLVTYDSDIVLSPPGQDTEQRRRTYASIAAHELAHQWFGDMVTMAWWNDVWLNESFATWMSSRLIADWKPEWHTRAADQDERLRAVKTDVKTTARRINQPAESKSDIGNAFDAITYQKGGSVLAMFENAIGPEHFQKAVHNYLSAHLFGNARAEDFLASIGRESKPEYSEAFSTFLNQNGVPQVKIGIQCGGGKPQVEVDQQRLLPVGSEGTRDAKWVLPLCLAYPAGGKRQQTCEFVSQKQKTIELPVSSCPSWVLANSGELGYYEAVYSKEALLNLVQHRQELTLAEQTGLFGDVSVLADVGALPLDQALDLASKLAGDPHHQIVGTAIDLAVVRWDYIPENKRTAYQDYIAATFGKRAQDLGWTPKTGESEDDKLLRPELVPFVAKWTNSPKLVSEATRLANSWLSDHKVLTPDMVGGTLATAAEHGDAAFFDKLVAAARAEQDPFFKPLMIGALGHFRDPQLANRALDMAMNGSFDLRLAMRIPSAIVTEPAVAPLLYQKTKQGYDKWASLLPRGIGSDYASLVPVFVGRASCSEQERSDMERFFTPRMKNVQGGPRQLATALESVHLCAAQKPAATEAVAAYFDRGGPRSERANK